MRLLTCSRENFKLDSSAFLFSAGCLFIGYFGWVFSACLYYAWFYRRNFEGHLGADKLKGLIEGLSLVSGIYVVAMVIGLLLTSAVAYIVYRRLGSVRTFTAHFAVELHFFNVEPLTAAALTISLINFDNEHILLGLAAFVLFGLTRIYYFLLAYISLSTLHHLPKGKNALAFGLGYVPLATIFAAGEVLFMWILALVLAHALD